MPWYLTLAHFSGSGGAGLDVSQGEANFGPRIVAQVRQQNYASKSQATPRVPLMQVRPLCRSGERRSFGAGQSRGERGFATAKHLVRHDFESRAKPWDGQTVLTRTNLLAIHGCVVRFLPTTYLIDTSRGRVDFHQATSRPSCRVQGGNLLPPLFCCFKAARRLPRALFRVFSRDVTKEGELLPRLPQKSENRNLQ